MRHTLDNKPAGVFKTFPEFSKLSFNDRKKYEALTASFPPISNISFAGLKTWWDPLNSSAVSMLNDNLVVSYWYPGWEEMTGLSLVGTNKVDESLCTIFDHLKATGQSVRLVHVTELVLEHLEYPEMFQVEDERHMDEYVYDIAKFYPLNHLISYRRRRVKRFLANISEDRITLKSLDLSDPSNQELLLHCNWPDKGINKIAKTFDETWKTTITHADLLGVENVCLYIDGELCAYFLYIAPPDKRYIIMRHTKVDYTVHRLFDYMLYAFARYFADQGVKYVNIDSDAGVLFLRMLLVALGPVKYFKLYTVKPAADS
jgi:hypothetical protein